MPNPNIALDLHAEGEEVKELHTRLEKIGLKIPKDELAKNAFGLGTRDAILIFQEKSGLPKTGKLDDITRIGLDRTPVEPSVKGRAVFDDGLPAAEVKLYFYHRRIGGEPAPLASKEPAPSTGGKEHEKKDEKEAEATTDENGYFIKIYKALEEPVNLEIYIKRADGKKVALLPTKHGVDRQEMINLLIPASLQALASEYERLTRDVMKVLPDENFFSKVWEDDHIQHLNLLHQATGWDARLLAMAAKARKMAQEAGIVNEVLKKVLYAAFRAGLPTDNEDLALVSPEVLEKVVRKAKEEKIVELTDDQVDQAKDAFKKFSRETRRASKMMGTVSSIGELLDTAGLEEKEKAIFENLYFSLHGSTDDLWKEARKKKLANISIERLKLQGKLAFLTLNSADLIGAIQKKLKIVSSSGLSRLVEEGYYRAESWKGLISELAGGNEKKIERLIPPAYPGKKTEERVQAYASDMARKVRSTYPVETIVTRIKRKEIKLGKDHDATVPRVVDFMQKARPLGFRLGRAPLGAFLQRVMKAGKEKEQLFRNKKDDEIKATIDAVKTFQRVYQITPTDEALQVAYDLGLQSAQDVVRVPLESFVELFVTKYPRSVGGTAVPVEQIREEAKLIYRKAEQVQAVTLNALTAAKNMDSAPQIYALSGGEAQLDEARERLAQQSPTLENLFGSTDFCECEHCRSVLSPAAYFVDLLHFLEQSTKNDKGATPLDSLVGSEDDSVKGRRPDLVNLKLTCENTKTELPYIDLVNEIFEFYIANNNRLTPDSTYDTGEATTPELLAEPQNIQADAYNILRKKKTCFPLSLPFDLWLESSRQFLSHFETPLWQVLERYREKEALELFSAAGKAMTGGTYYRAAIFAEHLGLSPSEYEILTEYDPVKWFELYGYDDEVEAKDGVIDPQGGYKMPPLTSAKLLSRKLGVSYQELFEIIQTGFVNPSLGDLALVWRLGLSVTEVRRYFEDRLSVAATQDFKDRLTAISDTYKKRFKGLRFDAEAELKTLWDANTFQKVLVLRDWVQEVSPHQAVLRCDFDHTNLEYIDSDRTDNGNGTYTDSHPANSSDLLKINLFVRLWKKLGWTIQETDRALQVVVPQKAASLGEGLKTAVACLAHLKFLDEKLKLGKESRRKLLTFWLPKQQVHPLYDQLFRTKSMLENDPIFDHPLGYYLSYFDNNENKYKPFRWDTAKTIERDEDPAHGYVPLANHLPAIQGAIGLSSEDITRILEGVGISLNAEPLIMETIVLLHRHALLAKALKLSVKDLVSLRKLAAIDPFAELKEDGIKSLAEDAPFQSCRFVEIAEKISQSGFMVEDLNYLLRHQFDPVGKYRENPNAFFTLLRSLSDELFRIQSENSARIAVAEVTDPILRENLSLVLPGEIVDNFFSYWNNTVEFTAETSKENPIPREKRLDPVIYEVEGIRVIYDQVDGKGRQRVFHTGVLTDSRKEEILADIQQEITRQGDASNVNKMAAYETFKTLLNNIVKTSKEQPRDFFDKNFDGFLSYADVFPGGSPVLTEGQKKARSARLALWLHDFVTNRLMRQTVVRILSSNLNIDPVFLEFLLTARREIDNQGDPGKPLIAETEGSESTLLEALEAAAESGVTASFFRQDRDVIGKPTTSDTADTADTMIKRPPEAKGVRFEGYLEVPTDGVYQFFVVLWKKGSKAVFRLDEEPNPIIEYAAPKENGKLGEMVIDSENNILNYTAAEDHDEKNRFVELKRGTLYVYALEAEDLSDGDVRLEVKGPTGMARGPLKQLNLYPMAAVTRVRRALILLTKVFQIVQTLGLNERELRYLLIHRADFDDLDFGKLPVQETNPASQFNQLLRLIDYSLLKREIANGSDDLIGVFENATRFTDPNKNGQPNSEAEDTPWKLLADLVRREVQPILVAAEHFGFAKKTAGPKSDWVTTGGGFANEKGVGQIWKALEIAGKVGVSVDAVRRWATPSPDAAIAAEIRNTVKACYGPDEWQQVATSIFKDLRRRKRDALVAFIMNQIGAERQEQLFEHFLVDPGMEPVVRTSRIQLAIASVQLFIQRCLLNLEKPEVRPSAINAERWKWMRRYRVWEANRKLFLYPENWLEPEFRDDKSQLFTELESALLQGDVSSELAEDAFFGYLKKLEEISRLEIATIYLEEKPSAVSNILHVIGRTQNLPHKYFYRRYQDGEWTPWEPVTAEIEGDHVVAAVWKQRLHLFWVTFLEKADADSAMPDENFQEIGKQPPQRLSAKQVEVQLNWSEYYQGEWTTRASGGFGNPIRRWVPPGAKFDANAVFIYATKEYQGGGEGALKINLDFDRSVTANANAARSRVEKTEKWLSRKKTGWDENQNKTAFRVVNKNSPPEIVMKEDLPRLPFLYESRVGNRYLSAGAFNVILKQTTTTDGQVSQTNTQRQEILGSDFLKQINVLRGSPNTYSLVACNYPYGVSSVDPDEEARWMRSAPFFYQDLQHIFHVEPSPPQLSIEEWDEWVVTKLPINEAIKREDWWKQLPVAPSVPVKDKRLFSELFAAKLIEPASDWLVSSPSKVIFDKRPVGREGD